MADLILKPASAGDTFKLQNGAGTSVLEVSDNLASYSKGISEKVGTITGTSGAVTVDLSTGTFFEVTLTAAITTWAFTNVPASTTACAWVIKINQASSAVGGTPVTWAGDGTTTGSSAIKWAGGTAHQMSTGNSQIDLISMFTIDGGTTIYANEVGKAFA